jgi:hypothetical protein
MKREAAIVLLGSLEGERDCRERKRGVWGNCSCWGEEEERVQEKGVQGGVLEGLGRRLQEETSHPLIRSLSLLLPVGPLAFAGPTQSFVQPLLSK